MSGAPSRARRAAPRMRAHPPRRRPWCDAGLALAAGALSALAQPPYDLFPILFLTLPALVLLLDRVDAAATGRGRLARAALVGWCFGFGYFLAGLWWIGAAFLVEAEKFAWLMPFAVAGLPAGLALFTALAAALAMALWGPGVWRILALALGFTVAEWLRGTVLTGFPWNGFGYALTGSLTLAQGAGLVGVYGLVPVAVFVGASPAALLGPGGRIRWRPGLAATAAGAALLAGLWAFGSDRLAVTGRAGEVPGARLRLVQPAVDQRDKWKPENRAAIFARYLELSRGSGAEGDRIDAGTLVLWPESALPFYYQSAPDARAAVAELLPDGAGLVTGALRYELRKTDSTDADVYNSVLLIGDDGEVEASYDKVRLVPFGEFMPFQDVLEAWGLRQLTELKGGFAAGSEHVALTPKIAPPFAPLICYEVIFPGIMQSVEPDPAWILNVTNDAWFGDTAGPHQHLRQAQLRAVETGLPVIRVANTGISAVIGPGGEIRAMAALDRTAVIVAALPKPVQPAVAHQYRGLLLAVILAGMAIVLLARRLRARNKLLVAGMTSSTDAKIST